MIFSKTIKSKMLLLIFLLSAMALLAQAPSGYYNAAMGKQKDALKTALHEIIKGHTQLRYLSMPTYFQKTDWHPATDNYPNGYYWDMYSDNKFTSWTGSSMNREHSLPKSWFGIKGGEEDSAPIGSDIHNLFPSNSNVNTEKSNYALGIAGNSVILSQYNSRCKVGQNTFPGYNGIIFEPSDEFKGDFARTFMYMVTRYEDYDRTWQSTGTSSMLQQNKYPVFNNYAVNLLLQWHRNDPVSEKEIVRNNEAYKLQKNRNPFVDFPVLAEYIWGEFKGSVWNGGTGEPEDETLRIKYNNESKSIEFDIQETENSTYAIYNAQGERKEFRRMPQNKTISIAEYQNGIYIVSVYTANVRKTAKFVKY